MTVSARAGARYRMGVSVAQGCGSSGLVDGTNDDNVT